MMLILLAAAAAAATAAAAAPQPEAARFAACLALVEIDPVKAIADADAWRSGGGGIAAQQCLGLAYAAQTKWTMAATTFEQAARAAQAAQDSRAAQLWVQAGNASLAGGNARAARAAFDAAIVNPALTGPERGEAYLDRARSLVALGDGKAARSDIDQAVAIVPQDPLAWLLSATLARRSGDLVRAATDIARAAQTSPDDASVAFEAGNIAVLSGSDAAARSAWEAAVKLAPASDAGKAAAASLLRLAPGDFKAASPE